MDKQDFSRGMFPREAHLSFFKLYLKIINNIICYLTLSWPISCLEMSIIHIKIVQEINSLGIIVGFMLLILYFSV